MKKLNLFLLLFSFIVTSASATHLMGGDLIAARDSTGKYHITLSYYRDTLGIPLSHYEYVNVYKYVPATSSYTSYGVIHLDYDTALSQLLVPSFPYGVETGIYTADTTFAPGKYRLVSNTCCRNGAILNTTTPLNESIVLYTDLTVTTAGNSTPDFLAMPIAHFQVNTPATYNPLPFDPDGDSISWALNVPFGNYTGTATGPVLSSVVGFTTPVSAPGGPFTMNPVTGEITWTPSNTGNYVQSFKITEYKSGVESGTIIRDMQYVVLPADTNSPQPFFTTVTPYNTNSTQNYNYAYYTPGQPFRFQINGTSTSSSASIVMSSYGLPYKMVVPATFTTSGSGNNVTGTMNWTPALGTTQDYTIIFRAGNGHFSKDFTLVLRKNPSTTGIRQPSGNISSFQVFPNPAQGSVNISVDLSARTEGEISVYNTLGQQVQSIYKGTMNKGALQLHSALQLTAGTYFVVLKETSGHSKTTMLSVK